MNLINDKMITGDSSYGLEGTKIKGFLRGGISKATWYRDQRRYKAKEKERDRLFGTLFNLKKFLWRNKTKNLYEYNRRVEAVEKELNQMMKFRDYTY